MLVQVNPDFLSRASGLILNFIIVAALAAGLCLCAGAWLTFSASSAWSTPDASTPSKGEVLLTHAPLPASSFQLPALSSASARENRQLDALSEYVSTRWQLAPAQARRYVRLADREANTQSLDPLLVLAVMAQESAFRFTGNVGDLQENPASVNPLLPHGLMQVDGDIHRARMPHDTKGNVRVTDDGENVRIGTAILAEYLEHAKGNVQAAVERYNSSAQKASYAAAVLRMRLDFERVVARPVLVAGN